MGLALWEWESEGLSRVPWGWLQKLYGLIQGYTFKCVFCMPCKYLKSGKNFNRPCGNLNRMNLGNKFLACRNVLVKGSFVLLLANLANVLLLEINVSSFKYKTNCWKTCSDSSQYNSCNECKHIFFINFNFTKSEETGIFRILSTYVTEDKLYCKLSEQKYSTFYIKVTHTAKHFLCSTYNFRLLFLNCRCTFVLCCDSTYMCPKLEVKPSV